MKKIITAVAAVAMAASMFAVDFSAGTKISGSIFSVGKSQKASILSQNNDSHSYANPNMSFTVSGDRAGAAFKLTTDGGTLTANLKDQAIWFKPVDMVKLTVGTCSGSLNQETITYGGTITSYGSAGFMAQVNVDAFALEAVLNSGTGFFVETDSANNTKIAPFAVKASYNVENVGTIAAFVNINKKANSWEAVNMAHYKYSGSKNPIAGVDVGLGYKNTFDGVTAFAQVDMYMYDGQMKWIRPEAFVTGSIDSFGYSAFVAPTMFFDSTNTRLQAIAKVTYKVDAITLYGQFSDNDVLANTFESTIKAGVTGSVGVMGYDVACQFDTVENGVNFAIPFSLSVSF